MKKQEGKSLQYLRMESYNHLFFVTASPIMNDARDLVNALELLWHNSGLSRIFEQMRRPANLLDVYRADYDPVGHGGMFEEASDGVGHHRLVEFVGAHDWSTEVPVWVLNPDCIEQPRCIGL